MNDSTPTVQTEGRFTKTLIRVLVMQVVALAFLWLLQALYHTRV